VFQLFIDLENFESGIEDLRIERLSHWKIPNNNFRCDLLLMKFESDAQNLEGFHFSEFCQSLIIV
jgi:hypothetical protein